MMVRTPRRSGFTLLEVLLASAIAMLLLAALYVAFDITLKQADAGREAVARGNLSRNITNRMEMDISSCIVPMPPKSGGGIPQDTSSGTTTSNSTASTASSADVAVGVAAGTTDLSQSEGTAAADVSFQGGLYGTDSQLTLFISRVPLCLVNPETANPQTGSLPDPRSDLRRITYYLGSNGTGLCRQERPWVTADGVRNSTDPDSGDDGVDLIAQEVTAITFSYFDGTNWQTSWTGSDTTTDGTTVKGPPRAVKVTMTIQPPGDSDPKTVTHIILVRAAFGLAQPPVADDSTADPSTTTGM
jgi:prepilin-type N-terminal cleavage/methylation domain-containing protein